MAQDTEIPEKIVIIGHGHAGIEAAAALRQKGFAGSITIVGDEPDLPYQRPPLSKSFLKSADDAGLPLKADSFFASSNIDLKRNVKAKSIDCETKTVALSGGARLDYDHLIIATGAQNRMPPVAGLVREQVLELRTLADARKMFAVLDRLSRVAIIGGGFIGLEVAALLRARDVEVDLFEAAPRLMSRVLSEPVSAWFKTFHDKLGTRLHLNANVEQLHHHADRTDVHFAGGQVLSVDAVVVAAGIMPETALAEAAGLDVDNGIVVDAWLRTSDASVSAIGDCAVYPNFFAGEMMRLESVQNAVDQARFVAARLVGGAQDSYRDLPWFWSNQGSARLQIAGLANGHDQVVLRGYPETGKFSAFLYKDTKLVCVESVNAATDHMVARRLIAQNIAVPVETARDQHSDLKALLAAAAA
ncbi:NAD(P)/FAD-dependent oxidoreductase [Limoniibacter endophyticus]|uniref:Oxidoreductase n=1 Tax=Limoniibacter endophyticus TaxID=1565040 RepID=A0A8J3DK21_9HYPH|nr:FAD/NAD(P)-binding oxidoreductase [Limoniibacter endophyticus]GHC80405.1 oxidoreductase [Limoniibacter endophyticus]